MILAFLMAAASLNGLPAWHQAAAKCTVEQIVEVGKATTDPFDVVVRVAEARCSKYWQFLEMHWHAQTRLGARFGPDYERRQLDDYVLEAGFQALQDARKAVH